MVPQANLWFLGMTKLTSSGKAGITDGLKSSAAVSQKTYIDPIVVWRKATPPSGITFYHHGRLPHLENNLFVATLKSRALIRIKLQKKTDGYTVTGIERWFAAGESEGSYGRLRDVVQGPDGYLYFLTNNRDGRGKPQEGDDHIYRIMPK